MKPKKINIDNYFYMELDGYDCEDNVVNAVNKYCPKCQKKLTKDDIIKDFFYIYCATCNSKLPQKTIKIKKGVISNEQA